MTATLTRHDTATNVETSVMVEVGDDETISFTVHGRGPDRHADVYVEKLDDGNYVVRWLEQDQDSGSFVCPEWDDEDSDPSTWSNGLFNDFDNRVIGASGREACHAFYEKWSALLPDRTFWVEKYEHGNCHYSVASTGNYPDRQWDVSCTAVIVVPPDATNPVEYANGMLDEYSSWCNGDVWGCIEYTVTPTGDVVGEESVWGLVGTEWAEQCAQNGY